MGSKEDLSSKLMQLVKGSHGKINHENPGKGLNSLENANQIREEISNFLENAPIVDIQDYLKDNEVRVSYNDGANYITGRLLPLVNVYEKRDFADQILSICYGIPTQVFNNYSSPDALLEYELAPFSNEKLKFYYMNNLLKELDYSKDREHKYGSNELTQEVFELGGEGLMNFVYNLNRPTKLVSEETKKSLDKKIDEPKRKHE